METATDIFEVLTATALLIVVALMGVILAYIAKIMHIVSRMVTSAEKGLDVLKNEAAEVFEKEKRDHTGTMAAALVLFGFIWRMFRKRKKAKSSKVEDEEKGSSVEM